MGCQSKSGQRSAVSAEWWLAISDWQLVSVATGGSSYKKNGGLVRGRLTAKKNGAPAKRAHERDIMFLNPY